MDTYNLEDTFTRADKLYILKIAKYGSKDFREKSHNGTNSKKYK